VRLKPVTLSIAPGTTGRKLAVRVSAKMQKRLRHALRSHARLVAGFTIVVRHQSGATTRHAREVRVT
jgi:hypothetical protein